jgi:hypothetical protein
MTVKPVKVRLGKGADLDLLKMIDGRVLIVGSSGSGKSYLVRIIVEQTVEQIPTIILDREGEFATLREKYDVVLIGEGGEADASVATAARLARMLVELGVSAVINLYDLSKADKKKFVRLFLEALLNLPRSLWRPMVVIVDEAHEFCAEAGRDCESRESVVRLMDSGRKRGIMGMLCTQRYSKLSKDAAAEANNVFIGRITLDNDLRRASDTLGFSGKTEWPTLRTLADGEWFAFGPALEQRGVVRFQGNESKTTHPKPGQRHKLLPPAPSKAILKVAPELAALKQKVAEEKDELQRLRDEVKTLRSTRGKAPPPAPAPAPKVDTTKIVAVARAEGYAQAIEGLQPLSGILNDLQATLAKIGDLASQGPGAIKAIAKVLTSVGKMPPRAPKPNGHAATMSPAVESRSTREQRERVRVARAVGHNSGSDSDPRIGGGGEKRMLTVLAQHQDGLDRSALGLLAEVAPAGGSFAKYLSTLRTNGWVEVQGKHVQITEDGLAALGDYDPLPLGQAFIDHWLNWCGQGGQRRMLEVIIEAGDEGISKDDLGAAADVEAKGGSFAKYLSNLRTACLVEKGRGSAVIKAAPTLLNI